MAWSRGRSDGAAWPPFARGGLTLTQHRIHTMNRYVTVGLGVLAGAALFEAALIPGRG